MDFYEKEVKRTLLIMGKDSIEFIADVPCGNLVALEGID
jgi:hypothetical protein